MSAPPPRPGENVRHSRPHQGASPPPPPRRYASGPASTPSGGVSGRFSRAWRAPSWMFWSAGMAVALVVGIGIGAAVGAGLGNGTQAALFDSGNASGRHDED